MKINHLGIATKDISEALKFWGDALGLENVHTEIVEDQKVRVAMLPIGESRIELLEPISEDSPITNRESTPGLQEVLAELRAPLLPLVRIGGRLIVRPQCGRL